MSAPREQMTMSSGPYTTVHGTDSNNGKELPPSRLVRDGNVNVARDTWPRCIVWTWIPGCTQCTGGIIGHMGIASSDGEIWEFLGGGASRGPREGGLAFGPVLRYIQLPERYVRRGTWDDGIAETIRKWEGTMHGVCVCNCHSFVADCLHEMRYFGLPCWRWLSYLLAVWIWVCGSFPDGKRAAMCLLPVVLVVALIFGIWMLDRA
mmetsp:Transcript_51144/g.121547  ORF Transcript_51144/g.121547 Transcript_51144/m.121547 type:complete len:206 (+) Transcript_51144:82-699(+)